jgi:hypothetical protein
VESLTLALYLHHSTDTNYLFSILNFRSNLLTSPCYTMTQSMFSFNIAFTQSVNPPDQTVVLSATELWYGIRRGGRNPHDFAPYVASCEVLSGTHNEFCRKLTLADGAVHTAAGEDLIQDVIIAPPLHVSATPHSEILIDVGSHHLGSSKDSHNRRHKYLPTVSRHSRERGQ